MHSLQNDGMSSVDENIKRQLAASESAVGDLRSEIQILQSTVSFLLYEKIRISIIWQRDIFHGMYLTGFIAVLMWVRLVGV